MSVKLLNHRVLPGTKRSYFVAILVFVVCAPFVASQNALELGKEHFLNDRMEEARPYLEDALKQNPRDERIYLYLSMVYEVLGQPDLAVNVLQRGVQYASEFLDVMYFNIGNNMFQQNKNVLAYEMYTKALQVNPALSDGYLNRANTALRVENYEDAVRDYELYLARVPDSSQREPIEQVIAIIGGIVEEERRIAEERERARREEEARKRALLDSVRNSLENVSSSTTNLSAETEDVEKASEESDIVD